MKTFILIIISLFFNIIFAFSQDIEIPIIDSVSINQTTGKVIIGWHVTDPSKIDGFLIQRQIFGIQDVIDGSWHIIDTILDPTITVYEDNSNIKGTSAPEAQTEAYQVVSYEIRGGKKEYSGMSDTHKTVFLSDIEYDNCSNFITIRWTKYLGWGDNLKEFHIYRRTEATGRAELISIVSSKKNYFEDSELISNQDFFYFIQAVNADTTIKSTSNQKSQFVDKYVVPDTLTANSAKVLSNNEIELSFTIDTDANITEYSLQQSFSLNEDFTPIATFDNSNSTIIYNDFADNYAKSFMKDTFYYNIAAINECGNIVATSNIIHNIVLSAYANPNELLSNTLQWNIFNDWNGAIKDYTVYRYTGNEDNLSIYNTDTLLQNYTDNYGELSENEQNEITYAGGYCYYVVETEKNNPYGVNGENKSNVACVITAEEAFIPNTFNPLSQIEENKTFRPAISFATEYQLIIYSRWGDIVFETNDYLLGWNGKIKNSNMAKPGVYSFFLKYTNAKNTVKQKKGFVAVFYP